MTYAIAGTRSRASRASRAIFAALLAAALLAAAAPAVEALGHSVSVIVIGPDAGTAASVTEANHGEVDHVLPIVNGVSARMPESRLDDLARTMYVVPDRGISLQSSSYGDALASAYPREVGAADLWNAGTTGEGVTVALVDTGVADVPDLANTVIARANLTREEDALDTYGHGTFQAGLIAGTGASSDGRYVGVAPGANLLSVKVADASGSTSLSQVLAGVQLVDSAAERFNVRVMLLALDSESPLPPDLDPLSWALRTAWAHGITVVVPAGNGGPEPGTIASPGEDPWLLTVGSVDDLGTPEVDDDLVSEFTAQGPTRWGDEKPDLAAPGEHLVSLRAPGSTVDTENPSAVVEGDYFKGSGTSMSAAVTAGAAALLLSERPDLSPDEVKALLTATATGIADGHADATGSGIVNASAAVAFDGALPELPEAEIVFGDAVEPFTPPGQRYEWAQDDDGVWTWGSQRIDGRHGNGPKWSDEEWAARQWAARQWAARQWIARQWTARQWAARQWAARQWAARQWAARQWTADRLAARQWAARQWNARQWTEEDWTARQWSARQWTEDEWLARQWSARQWTDDQWDARQWAARQWSDEEWLARQWSARQWSARQWSARQWSARQWSDEDWTARQWSARQWSARQWSARQWSSIGWG